MAKKKINELDASSITLDRIIAHANPSTGKADRSPVSELISLLTAQTPVKTYADETALLANTDLAIGYIAYNADTGAFYLYNGPTRTDINNYTQISGTDHFKGVYVDESALTTANPAAEEGDYAFVDTGAASPVELWIWDESDTEWVQSGAGGGTVLSVSGTSNRITSTGGATPVINIDAAYDALFPTREFNRTFSETLVFDKNEIQYAPHVATGNITFEIGSGALSDQNSVITVPITFTGAETLNFGTGFTFLYPTTINGITPDAGTYEVYFWYSNGTTRVSFPAGSAQSSSITPLVAPTNFAAVVDGVSPQTEIDLSWTDVANESSYEIQYSDTGGGGPWQALNNPVAGSTSYSHTGLTPGTTYHYRIRAVGDGVNFSTSAFSIAATTTQSAGDVTAPTFIFSPVSGVTTWTVNRPITLTADEAIRNTDGSAITSANVATRLTLKETNSGGANIAFTATIDATKTIITITPTTHYGANQLVYVAINNVEDVNGNEVTVAISSTFTTTAFTYFNGTTNRLQHGDILDSLFAANDTNFWVELTINNQSLSGTHRFISKNASNANNREFGFYSVNTDIYFFWFKSGTASGGNRVIKWTNVLTAGTHVLVCKYDGAIDTGDGLDRLTLLIDTVDQVAAKTLDNVSLTLGGMFSSNAQLSVGSDVNFPGDPDGVVFYSGEAKDFIVRSTGGTVVEINVPNLKTGLDTSGNARHGTWV